VLSRGLLSLYILPCQHQQFSLQGAVSSRTYFSSVRISCTACSGVRRVTRSSRGSASVRSTRWRARNAHHWGDVGQRTAAEMLMDLLVGRVLVASGDQGGSGVFNEANVVRGKGA